MDRSSLTQQQKFIAFKNAFSTYSHYTSRGEHLAAFVVAFSILEDRVGGMWIVRKGIAGESSSGFTPFTRKLKYLFKHGDIGVQERKDWEAAAWNRNAKLHNAMWNLGEFSADDCETILKCARSADRLRRQQKRGVKS
jgi:hypothetical protein